ncbi:MAG: gamma-glutamyltransferase, partial [bacterium]|nr:gamma-glutamyltransferase [bacterium]
MITEKRQWFVGAAPTVLIFAIIFLLSSFPSFAYQPAVVSAHPLASKAGLEVLKKGGSAADAAVATAFALSVVEPYNSGIGGGGFLLYYEAKKKQVHFVDYREVSPSKTDPKFFAQNPRSLKQGVFSVAVPGFLKGMDTIHRKWRKVSWPTVLEPAIDLASRGVLIQGRLAEKISKSSSLLSSDPEAARLYLTPYRRGEVKISQQDLAKTYKDIQTGGAGVFYEGNLGEKLVREIEQKGGWINAEDLRNYRVHFRRPHQFDYKVYSLYSSPLPSSGGNGLNLLFNRAIINSLDQISPYSAEAYQIILEALKDYFDFRDIALGDSPENIIGQTTHLCAIDAEGNIASMTNTLNESFGSGIVVPGTGIVLNNEMGDFSLKK